MLDSSIMDAIKETVKSAVTDAVTNAVKAEFDARMPAIQQAIEDIAALKRDLKDVEGRLETVEEAISDTSARAETTLTSIIPAMADHISEIAEALSMRQLDLEVHGRKWALIIQGIEGTANEDQKVTRQKCVTFATSKLGIRDAGAMPLAACHRLQPAAGSGIIIRFCDLADRNTWLDSARNLRNQDIKVNISPDVPPVLRGIKKDLLQKRKDLPAEEKRFSHIKYQRQWPYMFLARKGKGPINSTISKQDIIRAVLNMNPAFKVNLNAELNK